MITPLLLQLQKAAISVKQFYLSRVLHVWLAICHESVSTAGFPIIRLNDVGIRNVNLGIYQGQPKIMKGLVYWFGSRCHFWFPNSVSMSVSGPIPFSRDLFRISQPKKWNASAIRLAELRTSCAGFHLSLDPRSHWRRYAEEIGSLSAIGKTEEGTTPVAATATPGHPPGDNVCPKEILAVFNPKPQDRYYS